MKKKKKQKQKREKIQSSIKNKNYETSFKTMNILKSSDWNIYKHDIYRNPQMLQQPYHTACTCHSPRDYLAE